MNTSTFTLIGILNWNDADITLKCYESMKNIVGNKMILIIDNGSNNITKKQLTTWAKKNSINMLNEKDLGKVKNIKGSDLIIFLNKNSGYAKANNFGLKIAKKLGADYYLLSNNDVLVENKNILIYLIEAIKSSKTIAVVGPKIKKPNGEIQKPVLQKGFSAMALEPLLYPIYLLARSFKKIINKKTSIEKSAKYIFPYYVSGAFMLMDVKKIFEVGLFDENTFLYAEESILAEKLKATGYKMMYYPFVEVIHNHMHSTSKVIEKKVFRYFLLSNIYYLQKYKGYGYVRIFAVYLGQKVNFWIWKPIREFIKKKVFKK